MMIVRAGMPVARLAPLAIKPARRLGLGNGKFEMPVHFDTMHQAEIQEMFEAM